MKAINYALKLLKFRPRSENELRKRMKQKGFDDSEIVEVIEKLKKYGYLNEIEDAINYVKIKCEKGWSKKRIYLGLLIRGYNEQIINEALNNYEKDVVIEKLKREMRRKHLDKEKLIKLLRSRGFEWDIIKEVLKND
ncbi:MAG: regulatory protein RecX [Candidatus Hydrothermia bacterium]|jgi:regulatory protein|nr:regulatory protein RecX [Candidatus Hydrothermia bacterium]